mmetsp:Transcript_14278/g.21749  ORF Transcript_14278/g.21749 Transcript_14278/m.21749 type:complete len:167 (-) Transcript_14278:166-666(-)
MLILESSDGEKIELSNKAAQASSLLMDAFEDGDGDGMDIDRDDGTSIPVVVAGSILREVVRFLEYHAETPMDPIKESFDAKSVEECIPQEWYRKFCKFESGVSAQNLARASNYLGIDPLLRLSGLVVAFELYQKSEEEIRVALDLPTIAPAELEEARNKYPLIFIE